MARRARRPDPVPDQILRARQQLYASGAPGVHADQKARANGAVGATNRVGSRAARRRVAITDQTR